MSDQEIADESRRLNRRRMIQASAAAGMTAWTAPIIVGSLRSPAAATTITAGCYEIQYVAGTGLCTTEAPTDVPAFCSEPIHCTTPITTFPSPAETCLPSIGCSKTAASVTFSVAAGCNCEISGALAQYTQTTNDQPQCAPPQSIAAASVTFSSSFGTTDFSMWQNFRIWLTCS